MKWQDHTPEQLAQLGDNLGNREIDNVIRAFLRDAPSKEINKFQDCLSDFKVNKQWIEQTRNALLVKHTQETATAMAVQMDKLLIHTQTLNEKAAEQIQCAKELTDQNKILVIESKKLGKVTWGLFWLTVAIVLLTGALLWKEFHAEMTAYATPPY